MLDERLARVAPLFCFGFEGLYPTPFISDFLAAGGGGAILFARNLGDAAAIRGLCDALRAQHPAVPPLLMVDQEGGLVQRLRHVATRWPSAGAVGRAGRPADARAFGRMLGAEVRALGFDVACAPVLDVATNPDNPIIGDRAFSSDPARAAELATAFAMGLLEAAILPCGKHFPGHGDTSLDSHLTLPRLPHDIARLRSVELVPFRAAVEQGFPLMMTAHVVYEGVDPRLPATLSEPFVHGLLREELGFGGVVVTDDLEMGAMEQGFTMEEVVRLTLEAEVDLLLVCQHEHKQRRALEAAASLLERGALTVERLERSLHRLHAVRAKAASLPRPLPAEVARVLDSPAHRAFAERFQLIVS